MNNSIDINFTNRLKKILIIMLTDNKPILLKNLANNMKISKRTVQRELEYAQADLKPYNLKLCSKTGKGIWIEGDIFDKENLLNIINNSLNGEIGDRNERRNGLILEILKDKNIRKLYYYANIFKVSESTISTDLEAIETWLNSNEIYIIRKPGSGIEIKGSEEAYRNAIKVFLEENIDNNIVSNFYKNEETMDKYISKTKAYNIDDLVDGDIFLKVTKCILDIKNSRITSLTENSLNGLIIHISIAVKRIINNEIINEDAILIKKIIQDQDYFLAEHIVKTLEKIFNIKFPKMEIAYICLHIKGSKHQNIEIGNKILFPLNQHEIMNLINEMIDAYDEKIAYKLKQDDEFIQGLLAHLQPTFVRIMHSMKISNPVLTEVKETYKEIYNKCFLVAKVMENYLGKKIPEEEIGFLAIHFGAAEVRIEGQKEKLRKVNIGVICASGIGISRLITSKLNRLFNDRVVIKSYGEKDIIPYVVSITDFFISSIEFLSLNNFTDENFLYVNPLLLEDDIKKISSKIYYFERITKNINKQDNFSLELEKVNIVALQIRKIIDRIEIFKVNNSISFEDVLVAISEKASPYYDRQEIIQNDVKAREKIGTQVFREFGFALFHTRTNGVIHPELMVCLTKDKGNFTNKYFKDISVIIVMLIPKDEYVKINSEILGYISTTIIEDIEFLSLLRNGDKQQIKKDISNYLKKYFSKLLDNFQFYSLHL